MNGASPCNLLFAGALSRADKLSEAKESVKSALGLKSGEETRRETETTWRETAQEPSATERVSQKAHDMKESTKEGANEAKESVKSGAGRAQGKAEEGGSYIGGALCWPAHALLSAPVRAYCPVCLRNHPAWLALTARNNQPIRWVLR